MQDSKYALQWTVQELYSPGRLVHVEEQMVPG
jgi:hypothetical protein